MVGIPGSGKTTLVVMLCHLIHTLAPEYRIIWAGADELRNIKSFLMSLPKDQPYVIVFEDSSAALDQLDGAGQSEAFEIMTQARHITNSKVIFIPIYHYSKSLLKNWRALSLFSVFLSASIDEQGNIAQLIDKDPESKRRLKLFQRLYHSEFANGYFELRTSKGGERKRYETDNPLRISFNINLSKTHLMVFKKMGCGLCSPRKMEKEVPAKDVFNELSTMHGPRRARWAAGILCYMNGHKEALENEFLAVLDAAMRVKQKYYFSIPELADICIKERLKKSPRKDKGIPKRIYRKLKQTKEMLGRLETKSTLVEVKTEEPPSPEELAHRVTEGMKIF